MAYIKIKRNGYVRYLFQFQEGKVSVGVNKIGYLTMKTYGNPTISELIEAFQKVTEIVQGKGLFPEARVPKGDRVFRIVVGRSGYRQVAIQADVPFEIWTKKPPQ